MPNDVALPNPTISGSYQHVGKSPCTNHLFRAYEARRKRDVEEKLREDEGSKLYQKGYVSMMYDNHVEKKRTQRIIREKVEQKIQDYEESINKRREKLQKMLCIEEREFYRMTVEQAQRGDERKMDNMKRTVEQIRAKREEERLELVRKKRIEQYITRCQDLRPALLKKHLIESKNAQLQQMRENEAKREANKELDRMWNELNQKELRAKIEREERELLAAKAQQINVHEILKKQIRAKELLKAEEKKVTMEDKIEIARHMEKTRLEKIEELKNKRRDADSLRQDLLNQIRTNQDILEKRKREEEAIDQAFAYMSKMEMEREMSAFEESVSQMRKETAMYKEHLKELNASRKKEEEELNALLEEHRQAVQKQQDEAKCKIIEAKRALQCDVQKGRAEQLEHKKKEAEYQLKLKQAENELLRLAFETNACLQAESDRLEQEAIRQYRDDLRKQIEYNNLLRERERQELERQLQKGKEEEEYYQKLVQEIILQETERPGNKHPFRRVLEQYDCRCPIPPFQ
ncbi:cilia- and flagella-associated protein 53-like [Diorhabda sublineata]|uniref:cilia- and flagella-associated protein 53-like n=1 Tax=Diorhabda sublineata TaxID=1163346 RepID=UPI0024E0DC7B|nr:cilia- and flagella-associated protein 53-like [Diorhabda sublineata]